MALLSWPDWMPRPLREGYAVEPEDRRTTTQTEAGTLIRKEFDTDECAAECALVLNPAQAAWFEAFEHTLMEQGTEWFLFPLWVGGELSMHRVRFLSRPKSGGLIGLHTRYEFTLQVGERNLLDGRWAALFMRLDPDSVLYLANKLHTILHVESPGLTVLPAEWRLENV